jgi:hypothetical protein
MMNLGRMAPAAEIRCLAGLANARPEKYDYAFLKRAKKGIGQVASHHYDRGAGVSGVATGRRQAGTRDKDEERGF